MYSCANYPRGCRGRVNTEGGRCADCVTANLRRPASPSPFSPLRGQPNYRRAWDVEKPAESKDEEKF
ncbi:hypothetical protein PABG_00264 [Paracoccidioides brasiliensis Pb03]|uniref:Uncharacterized protein n=2 Tax=Paracoccidioides TaxID=38946 RepID=C1G666_PARBD|nr:hypothetical protein PAAG_04935 [Paracoccidioides lutzii Pb01]XP_010758561.1 uncharacterized protein PADG_02671 [Paracoccidioides brasiliensis Pb18]EEH17701.1 hypothetical protein PABG_00264 [Paracoccidioides brasiliensis Pb03]ODH46333.1 hypothetical protein GX48_07566 [Paracoccidioides brasiliensis]EEH33886.1 hypothetical protein PAAG_04935 [Paracoccidioides lutzii Pb01]EEH46573.1 hypothetical protein PADG_02671 [Paracoccidioides brasiliensis Pb18]